MCGKGTATDFFKNGFVAAPVPTQAPQPLYGYVPLTAANFLDFFTVETGRDIIELDRYAAIVTSQESSTFAAMRNGGWYILDLEGNEIY